MKSNPRSKRKRAERNRRHKYKGNKERDTENLHITEEELDNNNIIEPIKEKTLNKNDDKKASLNNIDIKEENLSTELEKIDLQKEEERNNSNTIDLKINAEDMEKLAALVNNDANMETAATLEDDKQEKNKDLKQETNKKSKRRKFSFKLLIGFIIFQFVFACITGPIILFYGPFEESKKMFVGTAMGSMHYQWLATTFLSEDRINAILGKNNSTNTGSEEQDLGLIEIPDVQDDGIEQQILSGDRYTAHVLVIKNPKSVKIGVSSQLGSRGEELSVIAERYNAIAGINGGSFTDESGSAMWTSTGANPRGLLISNGEVIFNEAGEDDTVKFDIAGITSDGYLIGGKYSLSELRSMNVVEALSFGPVLIRDNVKLSVESLGSSPKTLIGQRSDGAIIFVVMDSNSGSRVVATLEEAQDVLQDLGCVNAINLDGGKSTTMYYDGEIINTPSYALEERPIASGFIVVE